MAVCQNKLNIDTFDKPGQVEAYQCPGKAIYRYMFKWIDLMCLDQWMHSKVQINGGVGHG